MKETRQYQDFVAEHFGERIVEKEVVPFRTKPKDNEIIITNVPYKEMWYMVDHKTAGIRLEFKKGKFNTHQNAFLLDGDREADAIECTTALREIGDWLQEYFPELVTEKPNVIPKDEGMREPSDSGKVPCFFQLNAEYADELKSRAKESGMSIPRYIERMIDIIKTTSD